MDQEQIDRIEAVRAQGDVRHAGDDDDGGIERPEWFHSGYGEQV